MIPNCPACKATPNVTMLTSEVNYGLCSRCRVVFVFGEATAGKAITREQWNALLPECRRMLQMMFRIEGVISPVHQAELVP